ncbi:MAG TPA: hypothetical protein PL110_04610 [Candidatus Eremiobacteraeota bacterium]|nr:MAG: hypothetical protein BWY64_01964 [bacterium ADurb.Bin363]HPZ07371.1 hypothetical protein [Candidatus Eremiobacteraeota bacterium]
MFFKNHFPVKIMKNGKSMLNLGCGTKMSWEWTNLDFSHYTYLAKYKTAAKYLKYIGILSQERYEKLLSVDPQIIH